MFEIKEETKQEAVNAIREIFGKYGVTDEELQEAFDAAVKVVMKQFGF